MNETKQKGLITELQCELAFSSIGITLSKPIVEDCRYDYIADIGYKLLKIQCKTSSVGEDQSYIKFASKSIQVNTKGVNINKYTKEQIDYFYTYYDGVSYLVPVEECSNEKTLRLKYAEKYNNTNKAEDYELCKILEDREGFQSFQFNTISINHRCKSFCIDCGCEISSKANRCKCCNRKMVLSKMRQRPPKEELEQMIQNTSFLSIAKQYNVSDTTIRHWCADYDLPFKQKEIKLLYK